MKTAFTTKQAADTMRVLTDSDVPFAYVNQKKRRLGCKIWDYEKMKIDNPYIEFAPSYDVDTDEPWNYHK